MARVSLLDLVLVAAVAGAAVLLLWPRGQSAGAHRASWALTPGVVNPDVTPATVSRTICSPGWTRTIRPPPSYTSALKLEQLRRLGLPGGPTRYQEDHLISLELGGHPTDRRNLWPERRPRADEVDRIENELNAKICSGRTTLGAAQEKISAIKHAQG